MSRLKYLYQNLETFLHVLARVPDEFNTSLITKQTLGIGVVRYFKVLQAIEKAAVSNGGIPFRRSLQGFGAAELKAVSYNLNMFVVAVTNLIAVTPAKDLEKAMLNALPALRFIAQMGMLDEGTIFEQLFITKGFRTFIKDLEDQLGLIFKDDSPEEIRELLKSNLELPDASRNQFREMILTVSFLVAYVNKLAKSGTITELVIQDAAGLFKARGKGTGLTSLVDLTFKYNDPEKGMRFIRVEIKAWMNKSIAIDTKGVPVIADESKETLLQMYRYVFESAFVYGDMTSLAYVIPENVNANGLKPEMVRTALNYMMEADKGYLSKLLTKEDLNFISPLSGRKKLAAQAYQDALEKDGDVSIRNIMKRWDDILKEAGEAGNDEFKDIPAFAAPGKYAEAHRELADTLSKHLDRTDNEIGSGIIQVKGMLGFE